MNRLMIGSLTFAFATALLGAQTPGEAGEKTDRVTRRAQEMREQLGKHKQLKSHVRVQVRLKNGNRLRGVVKDGRLVERVNGLRFVDANAADKGAGIRLWYSGGTRNYVFVPFAELKTYNVLQRLSSKQIAEIEAEMQMQEAKRAEQVRQRQLAKAAKTNVRGAGPAGETAPAKGGESGKGGKAGAGTGAATAKGAGQSGGAEATPSEQELQRKWFKLLQDYPPGGEWNASKRDEIKTRFVRIGVQPSAREQRFVDEFEAWQQATAHFGAGKESDSQKEQQEEGKGRKNKRSSRRSSRKK